MSNKVNEQTQNNEVKSKRERDLEDGVLLAFLALERAKYLIDDVVDEYFNGNNEMKKDDHPLIVYGFSRYRTYSEIVSQLVGEAYDTLQKLGASRFY